MHGNIYVTEKDRKSMFNCLTQSQGLFSYRWDILVMHGNIYVTEKDRKSMFNCQTQVIVFISLGYSSYAW